MTSRKSLVAVLFVLSCMFIMTSLASASSGMDFSNTGGTLSGSNAGLSLSGSMLTAVAGYNGAGLKTGDLGSVTFTTGALMSGSLQMGGSFAAGGTFSVTGNGTDGVPNAVLFSGTFSGPVTWTLTTLANGTHNYTLTGVVTGMIGGTGVSGVSVQLTINTGKGYFNGSTTIAGGDTSIQASVPEPSTLALLGTGGLGLLGIFRRKIVGR